MIPAPIVPIPAIKNGIDTCNVVCHQISGLSAPFRTKPSSPFPLPSPPPPLSDPGSGSDDAIDCVIIEASEPVVDEGCSTDNLSLSSGSSQGNFNAKKRE